MQPCLRDVSASTANVVGLCTEAVPHVGRTAYCKCYVVACMNEPGCTDRSCMAWAYVWPMHASGVWTHNRCGLPCQDKHRISSWIMPLVVVVVILVGSCTYASFVRGGQHTKKMFIFCSCIHRCMLLPGCSPCVARASATLSKAEGSGHKPTPSALQVWLVCSHSSYTRLQLKRRSNAWRVWQWSVQDVNADVRRTYGSPSQKRQLSITLLFRECRIHEYNASICSGARFPAYSATSVALERCSSSPGADAF